MSSVASCYIICQPFCTRPPNTVAHPLHSLVLLLHSLYWTDAPTETSCSQFVALASPDVFTHIRIRIETELLCAAATSLGRAAKDWVLGVSGKGYDKLFLAADAFAETDWVCCQCRLFSWLSTVNKYGCVNVVCFPCIGSFPVCQESLP